jgi:Rod binding domain-containing protein
MNVDFSPSAVVPLLTGPVRPAAAAGAADSPETFHQMLSRAASEDKKLADTAKQFEAVVAGEVLKAARASSDGGWLGSGDDDQTGEMTVELAEQGLAQGLAAGGALGIAKMVIANLHRGGPKDASS